MLRFSIRELLLLTLVVGLATGWWIDRSGLANEIKDSQHRIGYYLGSAANWRKIALKLGHLMRDDGWYVTIDEDGMGWGYMSRHDLSQEKADELNEQYPLAPADSLMPLQAD